MGIKEVVGNQRAHIQKLEAELVACKKQNTRLRTALMHDCHLCRMLRCPERERLTKDAVGWNTIPDKDSRES